MTVAHSRLSSPGPVFIGIIGPTLAHEPELREHFAPVNDCRCPRSPARQH